MRGLVLDYMDVGSHIGFGDSRLGIQWGHDQQLQAKALTQNKEQILREWLATAVSG